MSTTIKRSRMIGLSNVPEAQDFSAKFVYNFFTPDELFNKDGADRFHGALKKVPMGLDGNIYLDNMQNEVTMDILQSEMARFAELNWSPSLAQNATSITDKEVQDLNLGTTGFLKNHSGLINNENSITSPVDSAVSIRDINLRQRLVHKIKTIAKMKAGEDYSAFAESILQSFAGEEHIDSSIVEELLSKLSFTEAGFVNELKKVDRTMLFKKASDLIINSSVDRRIGQQVFNSLFDKKIDTIQLEDKFKKDNKDNHLLLRGESQRESFVPTMMVLPGKTMVNHPSEEMITSTVGYIVEKRRLGSNGLFDENTAEKFYLDGEHSTKFIDTQVVYNTSYEYTVRSVYIIKFTATIADNATTNLVEAGHYQCMALIASKRSNPEVVRTIETQPPREPDGVLYRYNYDKGTGLLINWQMPAGKQRDVKYFQVFRRRNIFEPFTCIAELDFNDTMTKDFQGKKVKPIDKPEVIRDDRVYKFTFPRTFFNDARFDRRSQYIYAVAACDAHGLSSGYSAQTEVGFDRIKNRITLKTISRPGAPKQYPNFFIDPKLDDNFAVDSLTTDVMLTSKKQDIFAFFDPDCVTATYTKDTGVTHVAPIARTKNKEDTEYVINILNVDRQKAQNFVIKINDKSKMINV